MPDEPVSDDVAGLRAANARLRGLLADRDEEAAALRAGLEAERELRRRLKLRLAELERRLGMDSSDLWHYKCYWCTRPKDYNDIQIDHIIPQTVTAPIRASLRSGAR